MIYNTICQNDDDQFYTAVCAYVRGEPNGIEPGTAGEEQAEIAKRLLQDNPAILDDKDRLLAVIADIHYCKRGFDEEEFWLALWEDDLYAHLVAYVRGKLRKVAPHLDRWAKQAKQLAAEDPTILDDQKRLLAATRYWSPNQADLLEPPEGWLVHNGRINRDCISNAEYDRRMEERRVAGLLIDPSTAEICWNFGNYFDVYGDGLPFLPEEQLLFDYHDFARAPGSDIWVFFGDLPDATQEAIGKRSRSCELALTRMGNFD